MANTPYGAARADYLTPRSPTRTAALWAAAIGRRLRSAISVCPPPRLWGSSASRLGGWATKAGNGRPQRAIGARTHDPRRTPGRRDALLRPAPLGTVRAPPRRTRLEQAPWAVCAALKILPRSRRTLSSCSRQFTASQPRATSSGPFTCIGVQLSRRFRWVRVLRPQRLTRHKSACFRSRAPGPVSGQLYGCPPVWRYRRQMAPLSCFLSAAGIRFLGVLFPPRDSASLTVGLPPRLPGRDGPDRVSTFHTHETRPGRVPPVPREQRYPHDRRRVLGRRLPILSGSLLIIPASTTRLGELP
jgi:hypothetical protein